uniref:60S ribosomal protein L31 n=1 Tax=Pelusios castaneus TaxID=367368 RepID=A0A8C8R8M5_9SAUR
MAPAKKGSEKKKGEYTINIHKQIHGVGFKKRAPCALKEIHKFNSQLNSITWFKKPRNNVLNYKGFFIELSSNWELWVGVRMILLCWLYGSNLINFVVKSTFENVIRSIDNVLLVLTCRIPSADS